MKKIFLFMLLASMVSSLMSCSGGDEPVEPGVEKKRPYNISLKIVDKDRNNLIDLTDSTNMIYTKDIFVVYEGDTSRVTLTTGGGDRDPMVDPPYNWDTDVPRSRMIIYNYEWLGALMYISFDPSLIIGPLYKDYDEFELNIDGNAYQINFEYTGEYPNWYLNGQPFSDAMKSDGSHYLLFYE